MERCGEPEESLQVKEVRSRPPVKSRGDLRGEVTMEDSGKDAAEGRQSEKPGASNSCGLVGFISAPWPLCGRDKGRPDRGQWWVSVELMGGGLVLDGSQ